MGLSVRRRLPRPCGRGRARDALRKHRSHEQALGRDRQSRLAGRPRRTYPRRGRLAWQRRTHQAQKHHNHHLAGLFAGAQSVENIWEYLRKNKLANRIYETYEDIVEACCDAWRSLIAAPDRIASITQRSWASVS